MSTELARQLQGISIPRMEIKTGVSLLFTSQEVKDQTMDYVFNIGKNGLLELIRIDPSFIVFDTTLFGNKLRGLDREHETEQVNKDLDDLIKQFLYTVSPYMLLKASQKCLEYLFRHFFIHIYNVSDVIFSVLPYHESTFFPKVISLLVIEKDALWSFLGGVKRNKTFIARSYLASQCINRKALLLFILQNMQEMTKSDYNCTLHLTFVIALLFDFIKLQRLDESTVRSIISFCLEGIKCIKEKEYQAGSYLILCQLSSIITLDNKVLVTCLQSMFKNYRIENIQLILQTYLILTKTKQDISSIEQLISLESINDFIQDESVIYNWNILKEKYDLYSLAHLFTKNILELYIKNNQCYEFLKTIILSIQEENYHDYFILLLSSMNEIYRSYNTESMDKAVESRYAILLRFLASHFGSLFDTEFTPLSISYEHMNILIESIFNGGEHMLVQKGVSIYSALHSEEEEIREKGLSLLLSTLTTTNNNNKSLEFSTEFLHSSLSLLLHDKSQRIVKLILSLSTELLLSIFTIEQFTIEIISLLSSSIYIQNPNYYEDILLLLLKHIQSIHYSQDYSLDSLLIPLFCYLPISDTITTIQQETINTLVTLSHPLLLNIKTIIPVTTKESPKKTKEQQSSPIYIQLINLFTKNIQENLSLLSLSPLFLNNTISIIPQWIYIHILCHLLHSNNIHDSTILFSIYNNLLSVLIQYIQNDTLDISNHKVEYNDILTISPLLPITKQDLYFYSFDVLYFLINIIDFTLYSPITKYGDNPKDVSHPINILINLYAIHIDSPFIQGIINQLIIKVNAEKPLSLYLQVLSLNSMIKTVFIHIMKSILVYLQETKELYIDTYISIYQNLLLFLNHEDREIRSLTLHIFEEVQKLNNSVIIPTSISNMNSLQQFKSVSNRFNTLILSIQTEIQEDNSYFKNYIRNLYNKKSEPNFESSFKCINYIMISIIMSTSSYYQKMLYLSLNDKYILDMNNSQIIIRTLMDSIENPHYIEGSETQFEGKAIQLVNAYDIRIWKHLIRLFIKNISFNSKNMDMKQAYKCYMLYLTHYNSYYYINMKTNIIDSYIPLVDILINSDKDFYINITEDQLDLIFHTLSSILYSPCDIDSNIIYNSINRMNLPFSLFIKESNNLMSDIYTDLFDKSKKIAAITVFIEIFRNDNRFKNEINSISMLTSILSYLIALIPNNNNNSNNKDNNNNNNNESIFIPANIADNEAIIHSSEYIIQTILECLIIIVNNSQKENKSSNNSNNNNNNNKKSMGINNNTNNNTINNKQEITSVKRRRSGSFSVIIEQDIYIDPSILIHCLNTISSIQVKHTCLRLLGTLCSIQPHTIFPYLYTSLEDLAYHIYTEEDENYSYLQTTKSVFITTCPHLREYPEYIIQIYKLFVPCLLSLSSSQAISFGIQLITSSSSRYLPHLLALLLSIYAGYTMEGNLYEEKHYIIHSEKYNDIILPIEKSTVYTFIQGFIHTFSCTIQVQCILIILSACENIPYEEEMEIENKENNTNNKNKVFNESVQTLIKSFKKEQIEDKAGLRFLNILLHCISDIVSHEDFIRNISSLPIQQQNSIQNIFLSITESLLLLIQICNDIISSNIEEDLNIWQKCQESTYLILGIINELLNTPAFITVISELLKHQDLSVRRRALQMLNSKLSSTSSSLTIEEQSLYIDLIDDIDDILTNEQDTILNKQTAVLSLHILAQYFGSLSPKSFVPSLIAVISIISKTELTTTSDNERDVFLGSLYMCISVLITKVGVLIIPFLPRFFKPYLDHFEYYLQNPIKGEQVLLFQSLLATMSAIIMNQPNMISPYMKRILIILLTPSLLTTASNSINKSLDTLFTIIPKYISCRLLLPSLYDIYSQLNNNSISISTLYLILQNTFDILESNDIELIYIKAWDFCNKGLEARYQYDLLQKECSLEQHQEFIKTEQAICNCMIHLIIKLNEKQFQPIYVASVSWMENQYIEEKESMPPRGKCIAFFTFILNIIQKLKSIFIPYFSNINEVCKCIYEQFYEQGKKKQNKLNYYDIYLIELVSDCLFNEFKYNTISYIDEDKFNLYKDMLISTYNCIYIPGGLERFRSMMLDHVCPAITELVATTSGHDVWWKSLNYDILMFTREDVPTVKYIALKNIQDCFTRASQEYISLIPDCIPFLANLLEDSDVAVERLASDVKIQLETLSGEQLDNFLTV
ncbi:hypothetical protein WA158_006287 [Blastocystis sp. Blastoise]